MVSALSSKAAEDAVLVVDELKMDEAKTKTIAAMLKGMEVSEKALIVTADMEKNVYLSARNIAGVDASYVGMLNVYAILGHDKLVLAKDALQKLEEVYA